MKKILVGIDGSAREKGVLDAAVELARKTGAKLILFRSVGLQAGLPSDVHAIGMSPDDIVRALESRAKKMIDELAREIDPALVHSAHVGIGTPWQAVCAAAEQDDVDLIVIGSHGYGGIDRMIGTTAAKIVNHADRNVMVVRAPERL